MKAFLRRHPVGVGFVSFSLFCLGLFLLYRLSPAFAEGFSVTVGAAVRLTLAFLSAPFPFSLFEFLIAAFVLYTLGVFVCGIVFWCRRKKSRALKRMALAVPATLLAVWDLFCLGFAPCYYRLPASTHMALPMDEVDENAVFDALEGLVAVIAEAEPRLILNEAGESLPSYPLSELKKKVVAAADAFGKENPFYQVGGFPAKSFLSSPLMTYTHISGIYGFFVGEAGVNTNYPHFVVCATLAHETCHARGIAAENECNFLGAVLLMESEDPYLRYCGAASLLDDLYSVCRKADRERCEGILQNLPAVYARDQAAYSRFFEPYRDSTASKVADQTNSAYLQSMGQSEGTVSYSRVIRLTAAWFRSQKNTQNP